MSDDRNRDIEDYAKDNAYYFLKTCHNNLDNETIFNIRNAADWLGYSIISQLCDEYLELKNGANNVNI